MAFISHNGTLCRDMWPRKSAGLPSDYESLESLPKWRVLPDAYEELCERVDVEGSATTTVKVLAVHPELHGRMQLAICLQGIVGEVQLKAKGDWTREIEHAVKAQQTLTLVNEGCGTAFVHQRNAVSNLEELIMNQLSQGGEGQRKKVIKGGAICLRRRAFTKAGEGVQKTVLRDIDDRNGTLAKMSHMWVVDHMVKASVLHPSGAFTKVHPNAIRRGDLVDVAATIEVVNMRGRRGRRSEVMLSPTHIVRLKSAIQLKAEGGLGTRASELNTGPDGPSLPPLMPVCNGLDDLEEEEEHMLA